MTGRLQFQESGSGSDTIICVHGWACEGGQFEALSRLLEKRFRVLRPDLPGHGATPLGDFQPSFEGYARCIADFALEQGAESPILLGHSAGGVQCLMAAGDSRLRPKAFINLDGGLPPATRTIAGQALLRGWLSEPNFRSRLAEALRQTFFLPEERDERCEAILRTMCSAPEAVLHYLPEQITGLDAHGTLSRLQAPAIYIGSTAPRYDEAKAASEVPGLRFRQIPEAGHFLQVYASEKVAEIAMDFLDSPG